MVIKISAHLYYLCEIVENNINYQAVKDLVKASLPLLQELTLGIQDYSEGGVGTDYLGIKILTLFAVWSIKQLSLALN